MEKASQLSGVTSVSRVPSHDQRRPLRTLVKLLREAAVQDKHVL